MDNNQLKRSKRSYPYYTIGHSTHSINEFVDILLKQNINLLVDVRSLPGSNKYPQYNKENMIDILKYYNINYKHIPKLGGLRKNNLKILPNINGFWKNKSFRNYADYAMSNNGFKEGLSELIELGYKYCCVIMCAEVLWWKCHRRIITDYLLSENKKVYHIFDSKNIKEALMTNNAKIIKNKIIIYPENYNNRENIF